ncbi:2-keto-4-pentenoate hydratase [Sinorhizobium sp. BG8]|uniref:2-keto-4-pentenoate hydratase n=1 Tax=Sinorhizobium sp. BG8 TaxID=2613773 RepID=UPI00193D35E3|nr:2-keto-4-pentenoate hydratase [Sinorhizobium sp. BG8]QRM53256.1 2-keto-4-pentenoate hydratase [Sinorhizobium sp. BG8]
MSETDRVDLTGVLAEKLSEAERLGSELSFDSLQSDGLVPDTIEAGIAAQAAATRAIGKGVAGWKIAISASGTAVAAPILDAYLVDSDARVEILKPGVKAIEVEICFQLKEDVPPPLPGSPYSREDALGKIGSIHLGAELIDYRIDQRNKVPFPLFLADRLGNHSYVIGPEVSAELVDLLASGDASRMSLHLDDQSAELFSGTPSHPQKDPLLPLIAFMNNPNDGLGGLKRGQFVTTGSLCGAIPIRSDANLHVYGDMLPQMKLVMTDASDPA